MHYLLIICPVKSPCLFQLKTLLLNCFPWVLSLWGIPYSVCLLMYSIMLLEETSFLHLFALEALASLFWASGSSRDRSSRVSFGTEAPGLPCPQPRENHDLLPFLQHPFPSLRLLIPARVRGTHPFVKMKGSGVSITQRNEIQNNRANNDGNPPMERECSLWNSSCSKYIQVISGCFVLRRLRCNESCCIPGTSAMDSDIFQ